MTGFSCKIAAINPGLHAQTLAGAWTTTEDGLQITVQGRPCWTDARLNQLDVTRGAPAAIAEAYRRYGIELFECIRGNFALVVVDTRREWVIGGVDRMGRQQLYHASRGNHLGIGSTAAISLDAAGLDALLSSQYLFHYLYFHMIPAPDTAFEGVGKLPAAHRFSWSRGRIEISPYWIPTFQEPHEASTEDLLDYLRRAVARVVTDEATGAFLSGGLDSSTVAGFLAMLRPGEADTFSIGFAAEGYDEMAYARTAAAHFGTRAHEHYVTPGDIVETIPKIAAAYDEPFGNSSALPAYFCASMAADSGIQRLLAGDGGDELFAGNERYAKQGVFEHWGRIPAPLRSHLLEPILTRLPKRPGLLRKTRSYVEQARTPLPDRLQSYNFLHRIDPAEILSADYLESVDLGAPLTLQRSIYHRPENASSLNRMMYLDWQITLADNDLRKVSRMCELAGVDVAYPMLDDDLVEFSLRVPSVLKLKNGRLRHFYKEALKDFLPPAIIDKQKHGFGLPFGVWMREHPPLQELAYESLLRLKHYGFIRPVFIERVIRLHREGHAAYYGELVWVLMMLDLWLENQSREVFSKAAWEFVDVRP